MVTRTPARVMIARHFNGDECLNEAETLCESDMLKSLLEAKV